MSSLIVSTDSYVTLEEADKYVEEHYLSNSSEYLAWFDEDRPQRDKIVALRQSAKALNNLRYKGRKAVAGQPLAFPRVYHAFPGMMMLPYAPQTFDGSLVEGVGGDNGLELAKMAQVVNAAAQLALNPKIVAEITDRTVAGIKSRRMMSVSEDYSDVEGRTTRMLQGIYAKDKVEYILNSWLTRSVMSL